MKHVKKYFLVFLQNQTFERLQTRSGRVEHRDFGSIQTQTRSVAVSTVDALQCKNISAPPFPVWQRPIFQTVGPVKPGKSCAW